MFEYVGFYKCSCIVRNGAKAMMERNIGLMRLLAEKEINGTALLCIVQQKTLEVKLLKKIYLTKSVVKMANKLHRIYLYFGVFG